MKMFIIFHGDLPVFIAPSEQTAQAICDYNNTIDPEDQTWYTQEFPYLPHNPIAGPTRPYTIVVGDDSVHRAIIDEETFGRSDCLIDHGQVFLAWRATSKGVEIAYNTFKRRNP